MFVPLVQASSGMSWAGSIESEAGFSTAVDYSENGSIFASAHGISVYIVDTSSVEIIQTLTMDFAVESVEFSSDSRFLVVGMTSLLSNTPATVVFEYNGFEYVRGKHTEDGINVDMISIAPSDLMFATVSESGDIIEWDISDGPGNTLYDMHTYQTGNANEITCIDHSLDGKYLLSGDDTGTVILWNRTTQQEEIRWDNSAGITDCSFSIAGEEIIWIGGGSLYIRNFDETFSYQTIYSISRNAAQVEYTNSDSKIAILVSESDDDGMRRIDFIDNSQSGLQLSKSLLLPHKVAMFSHHPSQNTLVVSTLSRLAVIYSDNFSRSMEMPFSLDTDQDNIPDTIDTDDDGDGILDEFDSICVEGNNCHLQPDQSTIRNIGIQVKGTYIIVEELIHLDSSISSAIRKVLSNSLNSTLNSNTRIDNDEFTEMQISVCDEFNTSEFKQRWADSIQIENSTLTMQTTACEIAGGLYGTQVEDLGTRIQIKFTGIGELSRPVNAPYNISVLAGVNLPTYSIVQNSHSFPIRLEISDASGTNVVNEVWNRRDSNFESYILPPPVDEPSEIGSVLEVILSYWFIIIPLVISAIGGLIMVIIRRQNSVDFSDLDTADDSEQDEWEAMVDAAAAWDEEMEHELVLSRKPKPPKAVQKDLRRRPKPPAAVQADLDSYTEVEEIQPTRRVVSKKVSTDVDFKHLVDSKSEDSVSTNDEEETMSDALAFITSKGSGEKKKKRPVRKKKQD